MYNRSTRKRILLNKLLETFHVLSLFRQLTIRVQRSPRAAQFVGGRGEGGRARGGRAARSSPRAAVAVKRALRLVGRASLSAPLRYHELTVRSRPGATRARPTHTRARATAACYNIFVRNPIENCELVG